MLTSALSIALAPASVASAAAVAAGTEITMTCAPPIRPGQSVAVLVGQEMAQVASPGAPTEQVQAVFAALPSGAELAVRLRIDGIDSPVIDRQADPPHLETVAIP